MSKIELEFNAANEITNDFATVSSVCKCISYVLSKPLYEHSTADEYNNACQTALFLADYAGSFIDGLIENIAVKSNEAK